MEITINNYSGEEVLETTSGQIARSVSPEQLAHIIDDFLNGRGRTNVGLEVGQTLTTTHPTLQRLAVVFAVNMLCGLAEREYTDDRNKTAIATAKKIKAMVDNGELPVGAYI